MKRIIAFMLCLLMLPLHAAALTAEITGTDPLTVSGTGTVPRISVTLKDDTGAIQYINLIEELAEDGSFTHEIPLADPHGDFTLRLRDLDTAVEESFSLTYYEIDTENAWAKNVLVSYSAEEIAPDVSVTVQTDVTNTLEDGNAFSLLAGLYNEDGILIDAKQEAITPTAGEPTNLAMTYTIPRLPNMNYLRFYLVDTGLRPYIKPIDVAIPHTSYYVSAEGDNNNAGTKDAPLKTIERALLMADFFGEGITTINLMDEEYSYPQGLKIENYHDIILNGMGNTRITGKTALSPSGFTAVTDENILARLPEGVRDQVKQYDLGADGLTGYGETTARSYANKDIQFRPMLSMDGEQCTVARWPNGNESYAFAGATTQDETSFTFESDAPNVAAWANAPEALLQAYWTFNWAIDSFRVAGVEGNVVSVNGTPTYEVVDGCWYFIQNLPEELDAPGEWFIDPATDMLYLLPFSEITEETEICAGFGTADLITVTNCTNITLANLEIAHSLGSAVNINNAVGCQVAGSEIHSVAKDAVKIAATTDCGVLSSDIHTVGDSCVKVDNGNINTLADSGTYVENCRLYNYAQERRAYSPAIGIGNTCVGFDIRYNEIFDGPCAALSGLGHDVIIEYNNIHDVCEEASDMGAFYSYNNYYAAGNYIRYNRFANLLRKESTTGYTVAIYFDELASGCTVYNNVIENVDQPLLSNGGRRISYTDNILSLCENSTGDYAYAWPVGIRDGNWYNQEAFRNLFPVTSEVYLEKYPELAKEMDDNPRWPKYVTIAENAVIGGGESAIDYRYWNDGLENRIENNISIMEDAGYVDAANGDWRLREDSPIYTAIPDFQWDMPEQIGTYTDYWRK